MLPKIAIIHSDTLAAIGLKYILHDVMPIVVVDMFRSVKELIAGDDANGYFHYFVEARTIAEDKAFFENNRRKAIVLSPSADIPQQLTGFHVLCTMQSEKQLIKSLLALEQTAHAAGRNLPDTGNGQHEKQLSDREIEVMSLIVKGFINKEIADRLNIALSTVITHRRNIVEKLGLRSVSALTIYAVTRGYVNISDI